MILSIVGGLFFIDSYLGTNFLGWLFFPLTSLQRDEGEVNIPRTSFKEVGGLAEAKEELGEIVAYFQQPHLF
jgi:ATP-dependent Zn protease